MSSLLNAAERFARAGIPVFPCVPGEKRPLVQAGLYEASTDLNQIRAWWTRWPAANLAMPTGAPTWDVLDIDMKNGASGYPALRQLKEAGFVDGWTHAVQTPSGGLHLYFPGTDQRNGSLATHQIDYRSTGGYVLLPPSIVNTPAGPRRYETVTGTNPGTAKAMNWQTARDFLAPAPRVPAATPRQTGNAPADTRMPYLVQHVRKTQDGNRNNTLFWAANRAIENGSTDLTPLLAAAISAGLSQREAARTIASAQRQRGPRSPAHSRASIGQPQVSL